MLAVVIGVLLLSVVAGYAVSSTVSTFSALVDNEIAMMQHGNAAKIALLQARGREKDALYNDDASLVKTINDLAEKIQEKGKLIGGLAANTHAPDLIEIADKFTKSAADYQHLFRTAVAAPAGQARIVAALPMRKAAIEEEKQLDLLLEQVGQRTLEVKENTLSHARMAQNIVVALGLAMVVLGVSFAALLTLSIVRPLRQLEGRMVSLAKGSFAEQVPFLTRGDEIGSMAKTVQVFKDNGLETERLRQQQEIDRQKAEQDKKTALDTLAKHFESSVKNVVVSIIESSAQMQKTANTMSANAQQTKQQSNSVAESSEQASRNVQSVASAAEELSSSICEVSRQVTQSRNISKDAVSEAARTDQLVAGLAQAVGKIEEVAALINNIASQTNLLALNATIEAARAGDAGKGFAVVANEVKTLAGQTAQATDEIGRHIAAVQSATSDAVGALKDIAGTIGHINEINSSLAMAVEQQQTATNEIARNVQEASNRSREVSSSIGQVSHTAEETTSAAEQVLKSAGALSQQGDVLQNEIEKTKNMVSVLSKG
ncbi:MAG: HAMP domain-containing protein [Alphaproteobacteria bacterium]|nr:MAG: HAMP domain-containing protein [Alphaproteobacteria bacterium]